MDPRRGSRGSASASSTASIPDPGVLSTEIPASDPEERDRSARDPGSSTGPAQRQVGPGQVIAQRYRLDRSLGEGGMGTVWAATHVITQKTFALKILKPGASAAIEKRMLREARAASAVRHPNVVAVHDAFEAEIGPVLVMDLLVGESLAEHLSREKKLSVEATLRLMLPVASALAAAHEQGIVHRDIKPANVFLAEGEGGGTEVKVLDFGIAKLVKTPENEAISQVTRSGAVLGTPCYMAPEQAFGESDIDGRADIWSLGIVMYECLSGALPTAADNVGQVLKRLLTGQIPSLATAAPEVPPALAALVDRMLRRERGDRLADLGEAIATMELCLSGRPPRPGAARSAWILGGAALLVAAGAAAMGARWIWGGRTAPGSIPEVSAPSASIAPSAEPTAAAPAEAPPPIAASARPRDIQPDPSVSGIPSAMAPRVDGPRDPTERPRGEPSASVAPVPTSRPSVIAPSAPSASAPRDLSSAVVKTPPF